MQLLENLQFPMWFALDSVGQFRHSPASTEPGSPVNCLSSCLNWVDDPWLERGSEVVERDEARSSPVGGCGREPASTASSSAQRQLLVWRCFPLRPQAGPAFRRGKKETCQQSGVSCSKRALRRRCSLFKS